MIPAYDSIEAWTPEPTQLGFDYLPIELIGAIPTIERGGDDMRNFVGLKDFAGWSFTMTPAANEAGSPGFMRADVRQSDEAIARYNAAAQLADDQDAADLATYFRKAAEPRAPEWFEANWLTQWLKAGLIREVTRG